MAGAGPDPVVFKRTPRNSKAKFPVRNVCPDLGQLMLAALSYADPQRRCSGV